MIWKKQERQQKKNTKSRQGQQMEQRYIDGLLFAGVILAIFGLANLWELVKNYVKFNKQMCQLWWLVLQRQLLQMVYAKDQVMQQFIVGMFTGAFVSVMSLAVAIKLYLK